MMELLFKTLRVSANSEKQPGSAQGFTLIELLIVVLIAGGIISGLMFLVVELLTADQREASRNQTQQEMQLALDYISAELREAVYVYDADCMSTSAVSTVTDPAYCPGLLNHLPTAFNSAEVTPILAFWKQEPLQSDIREACGDGTVLHGTPCIGGHAYALVIYSTDTRDPNNIWDGLSRITRYELNKYTVGSGSYSETTGYVDPSSYGNEFKSWPYFQGTGDSTLVNKQAGLPTGSSDVLVDFVDNVARNVSCPNETDPAVDPDEGYKYSAPKGKLTGFYGCVSANDDTANNRDVILYLRGNAYGRPTINTQNAFLPMIETQVLNRPVLDKTTTE
ncbi:MAG: prepilin-type N-terminal cleavage/methylation domain-containing protein [Leptolyngbyaceae bacterium]|nr:prepilin-type N-terminal cleavage/methylation domain-containing protein [Leptolyngbyaceae bacterium]